jgi:hypothetical protein
MADRREENRVYVCANSKGRSEGAEKTAAAKITGKKKALLPQRQV